MVVDFRQLNDGVEISYVNDNNQIQTILAPLKYGYYKYIECDEFDNDKLPNLLSFKNKSFIKREPTKRFSKHNINEYLTQELYLNRPDIYDTISKLVLPNPFSIDIETEINDEFGYSTPEKAENRIESISITDKNLNTVVFMLKPKNNPNFEINDNINESIENFLNQALGSWANKFDYKFNIRLFDNEVDMLNTFLECYNKYFHSLIGWNVLTYDWVYILNRCNRLGINCGKASPIGKLNKKRIEINDKESIEIELPYHRILTDYMFLFKESLIYNNLDNYSLSNIAQLILGLDKIMYDGNLRTLYETNIIKFIAYAIIDTILVMLIHLKTNLYDVDFFESYVNKIPYNKISQNAISEALIFNTLREENLFILETEYNNEEKRPYRGGYVKNPTRKIILAGFGLDFSGLYPNSIITNGISPEKKIDFIPMDEVNCVPLNSKDIQKFNEYVNMGFTITPRGTVYDSREDGLYVRIEKKLISQRKVFKGYAEDIYLNIIPKLEKLL